MHKTLTILLMLTLAAVGASAQTAPAPSEKWPAAPTDETMKKLRADMQSIKADVIAKNLTLTTEQSAKFWPLFETYQKEQNVIIDEQLKGIQDFVKNYETLDDAHALGLMNAHFDRDTRMNNLRKKYLAEFQKILPTKTAVRAMQIDRRLSLATQFEIASRIPLAR